MDPQGEIAREAVLLHDVDEKAVVDFVEGAGEVDEDCGYLVLVIFLSCSCCEGECVSKLVGCASAGAEAGLTICDTSVKVGSEAVRDDAFHDLAQDGSEGDGTIRREILGILSWLEQGDDELFFPSLRNLAFDEREVHQFADCLERAFREVTQGFRVNLVFTAGAAGGSGTEGESEFGEVDRLSGLLESFLGTDRICFVVLLPFVFESCLRGCGRAGFVARGDARVEVAEMAGLRCRGDVILFSRHWVWCWCRRWR